MCISICNENKWFFAATYFTACKVRSADFSQCAVKSGNAGIPILANGKFNNIFINTIVTYVLRLGQNNYFDF